MPCTYSPHLPNRIRDHPSQSWGSAFRLGWPPNSLTPPHGLARRSSLCYTTPNKEAANANMGRQSACRWVAPSLMLLSLTLPLEAQSYLSDSDAGYKLIEALQSQYCGANPTHNCNVTDDECIRLNDQLWRAIYGEAPEKHLLQKQCSRFSTRHELPGMYDLLSGLQAEIDEALKRLNIRSAKVKIGSLPVTGVNARVATPPGSDYSVILFNARFIQFAHEMTKVVARSIPVHYEDESIVIDAETTATEKLLRNNPAIERDFIATVLHFIDVEDRPPIPPTEFALPLLSAYDDGVELFAMAHEYAHVLCQHSGGSTSLMLENERGGIAGAPDGRRLLAKWAHEIEADLFATAILEDIWKHRRLSPDSHPFNIALLEAPDFYFQLRSIIEEARSIRVGSTTPPPSHDEVAVVKELMLPSPSHPCDLELPGHVSKLTRHPHPEVRRALLRRRINYPPLEESERALLEIASLLNRNAEILWKLTKQSLNPN